MKKRSLINSITLGGILAATYAIVTAFSVYSIVPILSVFSLMIMPIFAAYFASVYSFKETLIFNITTLIICFLVGIADPIYTLIYVLPTLIVGDLFGLFHHLNVKFYTTIFLQTIAFSLTNIAALYVAEYFYEIEIIKLIISDEFTYNNLAFIILFVLSGAEAIMSSLFVTEQLKKLKIYKEKENQTPWYCYVSIVLIYLLSIGIYFTNFYNLYFLLFFIILVISVPIINDFVRKFKYFNWVLFAYAIVMITINFILCYYSLFYVIPLVMVLPIIVYCLVKSINYLYNLSKTK